MRAQMNEHWHHMPAPEVLDLLASDAATGLGSLEVAERRAAFGPNRLSAQRQHGPLRILLQQFNQPLVLILLLAGLVTAAMRHWVDTGVILGVVVINAVIGALQESRAIRAIEALRLAMTSRATVLRGGIRARIDAEGLVPGDIVLLQSGDRVPADLRLLDVRSLRIDEAALTGESLPVDKQAVALDAGAMLPDRLNMAYGSTLVSFGTGRGVVVATGDDTEIGRIHALIANTETLATPLTRRLARFSRLLLYAILALAALTFGIGILHGESWFEMFMAAVALAVSAIPEGLPAVLTITLAIGVGRMARAHAIIRHLPAVETLGSTTVICSDKTGTLTQNAMTVQQVWAGGRDYRVTGVGYAPNGRFHHAEQDQDRDFDAAQHPALRACLQAGVLCNDARLHQVDGEWRMEGDPTEAALTTAAHKAGLDPESLHGEWPRLDALAFESQHQYMATLHAHAGGGRRVYVKGSAEAILRRCVDALGAEARVGLDAEAWHRRVDTMAAQGLRVLALAFADMPADAHALSHADVAPGLTLLGLQGMMDPPRPEAVRAVRACRSAGIQVKMITGDHAGTAAAVARAMGLIEAGGPAVLTGRDLQTLSDRDLVSRVRDIAVFARVTPDQKLRLVEALQAAGHVVAMTGDGVNDAPALRRADIGIAMGVGGTEVAKEAADMVLADDNFASIEAAVEEGRTVYDNLIKFITWVMPTNLGEALMILVAILLGLRLPILPVQILWINMTTTVCLGLMLAFEPKEGDIMARPPRDPASAILTRDLVVRIAFVGLLLFAGAYGLFAWGMAQGAGEASARTGAVNALVFGELFYLFNCRSLRVSLVRTGLFRNRWLLMGVAGMALLQLAFSNLGWMNRAFASAPVSPLGWLLTLAAGLAIFLAVEAEKGWRRRR